MHPVHNHYCWSHQSKPHASQGRALSGRSGPVVLFHGLSSPPSFLHFLLFPGFSPDISRICGAETSPINSPPGPTSSQRVLTSPLLLEPFPRGTCHSFQPKGESSLCHVSQRMSSVSRFTASCPGLCFMGLGCLGPPTISSFNSGRLQH